MLAPPERSSRTHSWVFPERQDQSETFRVSSSLLSLFPVDLKHSGRQAYPDREVGSVGQGPRCLSS